MAVLEACYDDGLWLVMETLDTGKLGENMNTGPDRDGISHGKLYIV